MIHPSYIELIDTMNKQNTEGNNPEILSRYSIVMAAAKRARQLIEGQDQLVYRAPADKPLSIAVEELRQGKVVVTEEGVDDFQFHLQNQENTAADLGSFEEESDSSENEDAE